MLITVGRASGILQRELVQELLHLEKDKDLSFYMLGQQIEGFPRVVTLFSGQRPIPLTTMMK